MGKTSYVHAPFPAKLFSIEVNCRFIDIHPCLGSILNVFHNKLQYFINTTTTAINTSKKKVFDFGQREIICLFTLVTFKGENMLLFTQSKQTLTR